MTQTAHKVVRAAGLLMAANLLSRVLGLLRNTAIAAWFGQNRYTDVYNGAFQIPDLLFFLLAGGVFSSAFVPVFTQYISDGKDGDAWDVFSIAATALALAIGALTVVGEILAPQLVPLVNPGFDPEKIAMTVPLTRILLPGQICFFLGALFMAVYYVRGMFLIPALGPVIYNLGILAGGWVGVKTLGAERGVAGLAWGALAGAFVGNIVLPMAFLRRTGARWRFSLNLRHPGIVRVGKLALPVLLGLSLPQVFSFVNRWFSSALSDGVMSALANANQIMQAPLGIFAQAISIAVFPTLAALAARGERDELRRTFSQGLRALWFLSVPLSLLMMVLSTDIVTVILQYRRFTVADATLTSQALVFYCIGLFAFSCLSILNRIFYAVQDTLTPAIVGTLTTVIFVVLNFILIHPLAHRGLALAGSLAAIIHLVWMLATLRHKTGIVVEHLVSSFLRTAVAAAIGAGVGWGARVWLAPALLPDGMDARFASAIRIAIVLAAGGGVYLVAAKALRSEEMQYAMRLISRRWTRTAEAAEAIK